MAVFETDCTSVEFEEGTLGGPTYYVRHPDWDNKERTICFRPVKKIPGQEQRHGQLCVREAGYRTDHKGEGACGTHSGNAGRPPTHGRRATQTKKSLDKRILEYMEGEAVNLLDMSRELVALKLLLTDQIQHFPAYGEKGYSTAVSKTLSLVRVISGLVDNISRIESRNAITANQVLYLRATIADIMVKWITDPADRERAVLELTTRMPDGMKQLGT